MLYTHFTEKLLGLKGVIVKNIIQTEEFTSIDIEMEHKPQQGQYMTTDGRKSRTSLLLASM